MNEIKQRRNKEIESVSKGILDFAKKAQELTKRKDELKSKIDQASITEKGKYIPEYEDVLKDLSSLLEEIQAKKEELDRTLSQVTLDDFEVLNFIEDTREFLKHLTTRFFGDKSNFINDMDFKFSTVTDFDYIEYVKTWRAKRSDRNNPQAMILSDTNISNELLRKDIMNEEPRLFDLKQEWIRREFESWLEAQNISIEKPTIAHVLGYVKANFAGTYHFVDLSYAKYLEICLNSGEKPEILEIFKEGKEYIIPGFLYTTSFDEMHITIVERSGFFYRFDDNCKPIEGDEGNNIFSTVHISTAWDVDKHSVILIPISNKLSK